MAKAGRRRKQGERHPGGSLKQPAQGIPPAQVHRMVELARKRAADPALGTSYGWLHLHGEITQGQMSAAVIYDRQRADYARVKGLPRRAAKSLDFDMTKAHDPDRVLSLSEIRVIRRYEKTRTAVLEATGPLGLLVVEDVVTDDHACSWPNLGLLRRALDAVAKENGAGNGGNGV